MFLKRKLSHVFYGWWIVSASFVIALYVGGVTYYGFTAIFEPIVEEMGWSYTQISFGVSLSSLEAGFAAPFVGMLVDAWGPRRPIFIGIVTTAGGLILLSYASSLGMFYGAFFLIGTGMSASTTAVLMIAVANWFRKKVGLATGIVTSGAGFGGFIIPVIVKLIEMYTWRLALVIIAVGMLTMILPLSAVFRHRPEQYGYLPDGEARDSVMLDNSSAPSQGVETDIKATRALRSGTFWLIAAAFTYHLIAMNATSTHVMPYLSSIGIARAKSSLVASAIPLMTIAGRLGLGWLGDKVDRRRVAAAGFVMMGLGVLCFGYTSSVNTWLLIPFLLLFGIGAGGSTVMRAAVTREYFGRANFGTIFGLIMGLNMVGGIIGPTTAGWVYDNFGRYQGIWLVFACLAALSLISVLSIRPVSRTG